MPKQQLLKSTELAELTYLKSGDFVDDIDDRMQ
jgi:hypothetical protein